MRVFLDRFEQLFLIVAGGYLFYRLLPDDFAFAYLNTYLLLFSEGVALLFVLLRKSTRDISPSFFDWFVAIIGSAGPLFVGPIGVPIAYELALVLLSTGILVHIGAKLSLNFSFGIVAANRGVKSNGLYAIVRHPMYVGYMVTHMGFLLAGPTLRNVCIYGVVWIAFILRILAEEKVLMKDPAYQALAEKTRWRLIPFLF